jgi:hypothetical protein
MFLGGPQTRVALWLTGWYLVSARPPASTPNDPPQSCTLVRRDILQTQPLQHMDNELPPRVESTRSADE